MADSDGKVRIDIDSNAKEVKKELQDVNKVFEENTKTLKKAATATSGYEKIVQENTEILRQWAFSGQENSKKFQELAAKTREYKKALDDANTSVNKALGNSNTQISAANKLTGAIKGLAAAYLSVQTLRAFINYSAQAVEAFRNEEIAIKQLNQTLQNTGTYTFEYSQQLQKLASEIQSYSNYGNEAVIKAQALGQAYLGNQRITEGLTKAVVDFAAATGMDLEQAFTLVGKAIGTSTNALGRYGIELGKGMSESQKMEAVQAQLEARYKGTAKEIANTSIQLKNELGELSKAFGALFNDVTKDSQKAAIKFVNNWTSALKAIRLEIANAQSLGLNELYQSRSQLVKDMKSLQERGYSMSSTRMTYYGEKLRKVNDAIRAQTQKEAATAQASAKNSFKFNDDFGISSGGVASSAAAQKAKDDYEKLQEAAAKAKREIELAALAHGTSSQEVQNAFTKYRSLNEQLQAISKLFDTEKTKVEAQKGAYQLLNEKVQHLTENLRNLAAEHQIGSENWNTYKEQLTAAQAELDKVNQSLKDNGVNVEEKSKQISSYLSSNLVSALQSGGNAFQVFSNMASQALQKVLDKLLEISVVTPFLNAVKGSDGGFLSLFKFLLPSAKGNVFKGGNVIPFARGGVVNKPTLFPMANGGTGLMGEAGAEAVMPLKRMSNGRLGVEAENGKNAVNVNIYNQSNAQVETRKRENGDMDIFIKQFNSAMMNEKTSYAFRSAYDRESSKGLQAV